MYVYMYKCIIRKCYCIQPINSIEINSTTDKSVRSDFKSVNLTKSGIVQFLINKFHFQQEN